MQADARLSAADQSPPQSDERWSVHDGLFFAQEARLQAAQRRKGAPKLVATGGSRPASDQGESRPPSVIAGLKSYNAYSAFEEIRQIGDGHQGSAVLLRDPWTGQCVVCKRVRVDCRSSAKLQQLEREVCVLHQMSHPNIISYLGSFQVGDTLNIITEHAAGDTLARKISMQAGSRGQHAGAAFASGRVVRWTTQLASALEHVHARAVLHRDVKSRNVFLSASDEIKLGDFGLATRLSPGID